MATYTPTPPAAAQRARVSGVASSTPRRPELSSSAQPDTSVAAAGPRARKPTWTMPNSSKPAGVVTSIGKALRNVCTVSGDRLAI